MGKKEKNNKIKNKVMYILSGSLLTENFFVKNTLFIGIILILMIFYISDRYSYIEQMSKIESLQKELKDAKYEYQSVSSQLTGVSRQSQVVKRIEDEQIGLEMSTRPTYEISDAQDSAKKADAKKVEDNSENETKEK